MKRRSMPDIGLVRMLLRQRRGVQPPVGRLEATYLKGDRCGPARILYEGRGAGGEILRMGARRMGFEKGRAAEADINARCASGSTAGPAARFAGGAFYERDLKMLFEVFPADARLVSLPRAVDGTRMSALLEDALSGRTRGAKIEDVKVQVVRYKPWRKCLLRYEITWTPAQPPGAPGVVYGRISSPAKFARIRSILRDIHGAARELLFNIPEPLGVIPELDMELLSHVPGVPLFTLVESPDFPGLCRLAGEGLRQFHALPVTLRRKWDVEAQLTRLAANAEEFAWMLPSERARIRALSRELGERLRCLPSVPPRLIHRDFHGNNVLADGGRIALVDFEDCAMGDAEDDVGSNWAQLNLYTLKAGGATSIPGLARSAFLEGYFRGDDVRTSASAPTHAALHCFLYAYQCLRHPRDRVRMDAMTMLAACDSVLDKGLA